MKLFFFDGDGTLYLGDRVIDDAVSVVNQLMAHGKWVYFCTNNSSKTPHVYHRKLSQMGFSFSEDQILISTHASINYLKQCHYTNVYWIATPPVHEWLLSQGLTYDDVNPSAVLLTYDTTLTYDKLVATTRFLQNGLPYIATHLDEVCPTEFGPIPDVGSFLKLIAASTGRCPDYISGKPRLSMIQPILDRHKVSVSETVFVGDRLYTDIAMGEGNDLTTVLTLTGESKEEMLVTSDYTPDMVVKNLSTILDRFLL